MSQQSADWQAFHKRFARIRPPYRVDPTTAVLFGELIEGFDAHVLELGVTPELADLGQELTAVDWSEKMLSHIWLGDSDTRRAILSTWWEIPPLSPKPTAVVGDASMTCLVWPDLYSSVFSKLETLLADKARVVLRCFILPDKPEQISELRRDAMAGNIKGFHAFKLRLSMAVVGEADGANIAVKNILDGFNAHFPDRQELIAATGWHLDDMKEMDAYEQSDAVYSFPTRKELLSVIPTSFSNIHFHDSGTYEVAEHCPFLVMDFKP